MSSSLSSIRTKGNEIEIVDQLLLPHTFRWVPITSPDEAHGAIKRMQIRGAPAIASLASLSVASYVNIALSQSETPEWLKSSDTLRAHVRPILAHLHTSRPTAVNLGAAIKRLEGVLATGEEDAQALARAFVAEARAVADEDVDRNKAMSAHGADWLLQRVRDREGAERKLRVLTVCNTGSLATSVRLLSCWRTWLFYRNLSPGIWNRPWCDYSPV
jgi:methylthioribose-1-phosphate isomerase